jgi:putative DNA primase/helicase
MFENQDVINYVMRVFASCVYGTNRWEEFYVLTGNGRNGKGVLADLLKYTFGDYYLSVDNSLFTKPLERKDQPLPAIVEARPKRIMMTTETESEDKLQVGLLKKISGGDIMEARTLNSKYIVKYVPPYKVFFQVNNIPSLSRVDPAVQNRMRVIGFPFKFVPNPTEKNHRAVDPDLKEKKIKSVEWRNEFVLMLLEYYAEIRDLKNLPVPSAIQKTTNDYFDDNNPLKSWLETFYTITKDENDYIRASVLKRDFLTDTRRDNFGDKQFKELLSFNGITAGRKNVGSVFLGLKRKECIVEEEE